MSSESRVVSRCLPAVKSHSEPRIVIVGSSFIGMECAAVLAKTARSVTVIGMEKVGDEPSIWGIR
jgi:pyruvate/2-oxoglutarate dehydrogenase complex dihydrolipoamide dehydrogenase (E3) component